MNRLQRRRAKRRERRQRAKEASWEQDWLRGRAQRIKKALDQLGPDDEIPQELRIAMAGLAMDSMTTKMIAQIKGMGRDI